MRLTIDYCTLCIVLLYILRVFDCEFLKNSQFTIKRILQIKARPMVYCVLYIIKLIKNLCLLIFRACIGKKKPCPNCGYNMLRKSKKCVNCGKPFGVFTFGRRQCTYCDHINLARMSACFKCGQSLDKAPTAIPKVSECE